MKIVEITPLWERVPPPERGGIEVLGGRLDRLANHQRA
jgi:hypothetical protein